MPQPVLQSPLAYKFSQDLINRAMKTLRSHLNRMCLTVKETDYLRWNAHDFGIYSEVAFSVTHEGPSALYVRGPDAPANMPALVLVVSHTETKFEEPFLRAAMFLMLIKLSGSARSVLEAEAAINAKYAETANWRITYETALGLLDLRDGDGQ